MKTIIFLLVLALFVIQSKRLNAQGNDPQNMQVVVNQEPHYPAGDQALYQLIYQQLKFPKKPKGTLINSQVILYFDVMPDSSLQNFVVMQGIEDDIDNQIIDIMKPLKFVPSVQNNTAVKMNVMYTIQVTKRYN